jgi:hypothetical protein
MKLQQCIGVCVKVFVLCLSWVQDAAAAAEQAPSAAASARSAVSLQMGLQQCSGVSNRWLASGGGNMHRLQLSQRTLSTIPAYKVMTMQHRAWNLACEQTLDMPGKERGWM